MTKLKFASNTAGNSMSGGDIYIDNLSSDYSLPLPTNGIESISSSSFLGVSGNVNSCNGAITLSGTLRNDKEYLLLGSSNIISVMDAGLTVSQIIFDNTRNQSLNSSVSANDTSMYDIEYGDAIGSGKNILTWKKSNSSVCVDSPFDVTIENNIFTNITIIDSIIEIEDISIDSMDILTIDSNQFNENSDIEKAINVNAYADAYATNANATFSDVLIDISSNTFNDNWNINDVLIDIGMSNTSDVETYCGAELRTDSDEQVVQVHDMTVAQDDFVCLVFVCVVACQIVAQMKTFFYVSFFSVFFFFYLFLIVFVCSSILCGWSN